MSHPAEELGSASTKAVPDMLPALVGPGCREGRSLSSARSSSRPNSASIRMDEGRSSSQSRIQRPNSVQRTGQQRPASARSGTGATRTHSQQRRIDCTSLGKGAPENSAKVSSGPPRPQSAEAVALARRTSSASALAMLQRPKSATGNIAPTSAQVGKHPPPVVVAVPLGGPPALHAAQAASPLLQGPSTAIVQEAAAGSGASRHRAIPKYEDLEVDVESWLAED